MTDQFSALLMLLGLPVELALAALLFALPLQHRKHFVQRVLLFFGVLLLYASGAALLLTRPGGENISSNGLMLFFVLVYPAVSFCIGMLFFCFTCRLSLAETAYSTAASYLTQHMAYCVHCVFDLRTGAGMPDGYDLRYLLLRGLVYCAVYFLIARSLARNRHYDVDACISIATLVSALVVALALSAMVQWNLRPEDPLFQLCLLYDAFCCLFVLIGQRNQQRALALQYELDTQQQLWARNKAQYEQAVGSVELINQKYHDLKHQVAYINRLLAQAEQGEKLPRLEIPGPAFGMTVDSGSQLLDTILTEKGLLCQAKGITFTCAADGGCLGFLDAVDLYALLGNALDNAIEGVSRLSDPEQKTIAVNIFSRAGLVVIQVENYFEEELDLADGLPVTQKEDRRYHGFGLKSIRHTVEKYGGFVTINTRDSIFLLRVTIPTA